MKLISDWNSQPLNCNHKITISLDLEKTRFDNTPLIAFANVVFLGKDVAIQAGSLCVKSAVHDLRKSTRSG